MPGRDDRGHRARRAVGDDRPRRLREHALRHQRERRLLADVAALGRGDREPVGVGILEKPDVGGLQRDPRQQAGEIRRGGLRLVREPAVGLAPLDHDLAAELLQKRQGHAAARAVAGVEPDPGPAAADRGHVHRRQHEPQVRGGGVERAGRAAATADRRLRIRRLEPGQHLPSRRGRQHPTRGRKELQAVVAGGIVARRDLHAARGRGLAHRDAHARRGGDPAVDDVPAERQQPGGDRRGEGRPALATVATHDDGARRQAGGERGGVSRGDLGGERRADDPAQPRHADDQRLLGGWGGGGRHRGGV